MKRPGVAERERERDNAQMVVACFKPGLSLNARSLVVLLLLTLLTIRYISSIILHLHGLVCSYFGVLYIQSDLQD